jgi:hypothetical protein
MLIARDGGCTKPCCTVGAYGAQVHHAAKDWRHGGLTNVDDLGLACGVDNRSVGPGGWTTRMSSRHVVQWIPPPGLDRGQHRINYTHRPELLLRPFEDDDEDDELRVATSAALAVTDDAVTDDFVPEPPWWARPGGDKSFDTAYPDDDLDLNAADTAHTIGTDPTDTPPPDPPDHEPGGPEPNIA